jgi:hypothetical protein
MGTLRLSDGLRLEIFGSQRLQGHSWSWLAGFGGWAFGVLGFPPFSRQDGTVMKSLMAPGANHAQSRTARVLLHASRILWISSSLHDHCPPCAMTYTPFLPTLLRPTSLTTRVLNFILDLIP